MSETDDTEILLLIPPDFFLVHSSGSDDSLVESSRTVVHKPSCTAQVLDKLVTQVQSLNTRLGNLELNASDTSFSKKNRYLKYRTWDCSDSLDSRSLDRKCYTFPRRRRRRKLTGTKIKRDLSLGSFDSSSLCSKSIPHLSLNDNIQKIGCGSNNPSDILSMDGDISSIVSSPNKKNDKLLLHEIDDFLNKVESYESPETRFKASQSSFSPDNLIQATGDYITRRLDNRNPLTNDEMKLNAKTEPTVSILNKYIYLTKRSSAPQYEKASDVRPGTSTETASDCIKNIPKASTEMTTTPVDLKTPIARKLNYLEPKRDIQPTSTPNQIPTTSYADTFRPSTNKIYNRATKILDQYQLNCNRHSDYSLETSYLQSPKKNGMKISNKSSLENRSLANRPNFMLNKYAESVDTDLLSLSELWGDKGEKLDNGRLEEEKLRREHCEAMIQDLQKKVLEQQEKLAVALKVDRAKDSAIIRLREAWLKITGSLDRAEARHKASLDKMNSEVDNFKHMLDEAHKKQQHFETELYKALDLAHDYQEKYKSLSEEKNQVQESTEKYLAEKNDIIKNKDMEIETLKENCEAFMRLNKQSSDCIKNLEETIEKEKSEHNITKNKLSDANKKIQAGLDQMSLLNQERELLKDKIHEERARAGVLEKQLSEKLVHLSEARKRETMLDNEVKSLQKNLELQKNELKCHYQKQLEDAVMAKLQEFQQQLDLAERHIENEARAKESSRIDMYNKQMAKVAEQHKLEINLLEEKQKEEIKLYRLQLAQASEKISLLESKLESYRRRRGEIAAQLHGVMQSQWQQALKILTGATGKGRISAVDGSSDIPTHGMSTPIAQDYAPPKIPPFTMPLFAERTISSSQESQHEDSIPHGFSQDKMFNFENLSDTELQQYVKLLLTKPPNFLDGLSPPQEHLQLKNQSRQELKEEPTSDRPDKKSKRSLNTSKPPWKA